MISLRSVLYSAPWGLFIDLLTSVCTKIDFPSPSLSHISCVQLQVPYMAWLIPYVYYDFSIQLVSQYLGRGCVGEKEKQCIRIFVLLCCVSILLRRSNRRPIFGQTFLSLWWMLENMRMMMVYMIHMVHVSFRKSYMGEEICFVYDLENEELSAFSIALVFR